MATETGPDLGPARSAVERLMDDVCDVVRPDVLDATGLASAATVVSETPCVVSDQSGAVDTRGVDNEYRFPYAVSLPATVEGVREGDAIIVRSSRRDPELVGLTLIVRHVKRTTFLVTRRLGCEVFRAASGWHDDTEVGP